MKLGCHVSISGSVDRAVDNAIERDCTAFQIFSRNPRSWYAKALDDQTVLKFKSKLAEAGIDPMATVTHMPYLPNLATPNADSHAKSVKTLCNEVERCRQLGIPYLVTHLGSHLGTGEAGAIKRLAAALEEAGRVEGDVTILLENTAGQKNSVGSEFEQWSEILSRLEPAGRFGVCFDTCHAFAAGYDMRDAGAVGDTFDKFDSSVGFERLKVLHLNDSKGDLGANLDRHQHIGLGRIGEAGMREIIRMIASKIPDAPVILETPADETRSDLDNINAVRGMA